MPSLRKAVKRRRIGSIGLKLGLQIVTLLVAGFGYFIWHLPSREIALDRNADGIVVLTGGDSRVTDALELLSNYLKLYPLDAKDRPTGATAVGGAITVTGGNGSGKTFLLKWLRARADSRAGSRSGSPPSWTMRSASRSACSCSSAACSPNCRATGSAWMPVAV